MFLPRLKVCFQMPESASESNVFTAVLCKQIKQNSDKHSEYCRLHQEVERAVKTAGVQSRVPHSVFVCVASMRVRERALDGHFSQKRFPLNAS